MIAMCDDDGDEEDAARNVHCKITFITFIKITFIPFGGKWI